MGKNGSQIRCTNASRKEKVTDGVNYRETGDRNGGTKGVNAIPNEVMTKNK